MDIYKLVRDYFSRMLPEDGSMKVLLLDDSTLDIISVVYSQSELLYRGVFLVDKITNSHQRHVLPTMRCICFIHPSSISAVCEEIREPKYTSYTINFSNAVTVDVLDQLAHTDTKDVIVKVEEYFTDFTVVNRDSFTVPLPINTIVPAHIDATTFRRTAEGLAAAFVALRRRPHIRFNNKSSFSKRIAAELANVFKSDLELYDYRSRDTLLLLLDRSEDPVTPLLTPWSYQAMLHEFIGLDHNKLHLKDAPAEDSAGYVFSQKDDPFFANNMFNNWGDLCTNLRSHVDEYKSMMKIDRSSATIEEVKNFMQRLPQTKSMTISVTKHVNVVSSLSDSIKQRSLFDISQLEQDIVSRTEANEHFSKIQAFASREDIKPSDFQRLCFLYYLRYERNSASSKIEPLLKTPESKALFASLRHYTRATGPELFPRGTGVLSTVANFVKGFSDVENIFTQHEPVLKRILLAVAQGKLDPETYPYLHAPHSGDWVPSTVIIFMCGGFTFEEAALVHDINTDWRKTMSSGPSSPTAVPLDLKVLLSGTGIHNTTSFTEALQSHPR